jgi:hypothetical protein
MKGFLVFVCIIIGLNLIGQKPVGNIYGIYWNGSAECLATVNQQSGSINTIGMISNNHDIFVAATFDDDSSRYIYFGNDFAGNDRIYTVNVCNAEVIYDPIVQNFSYGDYIYFQFSPTTRKIYAICLDVSINKEVFGTINQFTAQFNAMTIIPGLRDPVQYGGSLYTFIPDSNLFITVGQDSLFQTRIYTIDILTGNLKYPPPPISITPYDLAYDTLSKSIHGIYHNGSIEEYISINRFNGSFNIIELGT